MLGDGSFFLLNGDVLSAVDLAAVLDFHRRLGAAATRVGRPVPAGADFTPLGCDAAGRLVAFKGIERQARGPVRPCMFCGLHVLEPAVFDHLPPGGFACVNDRGYAGMLRAGLEVGAYWYSGPWFDLGTPARYLAASAAVLAGRARLPGFAPPAGGVLLHPGAEVAASAELRGPLAVGAGCRIEPGAAAADAVLWPGARLAAGERLRAAVLTARHRVAV
jgi:mannose-1-phosphate guanylyltransferase